jgi:hypothetical protein
MLASGLLGWLSFAELSTIPGQFGPSNAGAAEAYSVGRSARAARPAPRQAAVGQSWQVVETTNFRILSYSTQPVDATVGEACERLRESLCAKWHSSNAAGENPATAWSPKCDIVLHPNDASYLREVGAGATSTVASSLVDHKEGRVCLRRVDVRSQQTKWETASLPHELTHVILADCFVGHLVPRWIDEGAALLADPTEKQMRHKAEMAGAVADRSAFRVVELLTLEDYPANHRWGAFYGQSLSLVEYLTQQRSTDDFIRFVNLSFDKGYDASLREVYGVADIAELERYWQSRSALPRSVAAGNSTGGRVAMAEFPRPSHEAN